MSYYPQLLTGAVTQYPIGRLNSRRTIVNLLDGGQTIRMADAGAAMVGWQLSYSHLTESELNALLQLYDGCYGQWQDFTFLDPTDNLLLWSEDQSQTVWKADPLLRVSTGVKDPEGGTSAARLTNGAQAVQQIAQTQPLPGIYQYCLSSFVQATQNTPLTLFANSGASQISMQTFAGPVWSRAVFPFQLSQDAGSVTVGIRLDAGQSAAVYGVQLEAQPGAGGYKNTRDLCGVYTNCRFAGDVLEWSATGINQYACQVKLMSNSAG